jgi:hypothetical protein
MSGLDGRTDEGALPNLIIAGVAKAGTTSMFRYLGQHPEVFPSSVKEARYFTALRYGEPLPPPADYAALFRGWEGERYRLEATPGYFPGGAAVAKAVDGLLPECRVVVLFREPAERCWSWYRFVRSTGRIPKDLDFPTYLDRCFDLHERGLDQLREHQPYWGVGAGCYDNWIDDWLTVFGDRLHIEYFQNLTARPREVTETLCRWLDLDPGPCAEFRYHVENRSVQYKNRRLQRAALWVNRSSERFFGRHPQVKRALRGTYYRFNAESGGQRLDDRSRARLADFYAPHAARLADSLAAAGRAVPAWAPVTGRAR